MIVSSLGTFRVNKDILPSNGKKSQYLRKSIIYVNFKGIVWSRAPKIDEYIKKIFFAVLAS